MPSRLFLRAVSLTLAPEPMVSFLEKSLCRVCCLRQRAFGTRKRVLINPLQLERNVTAYESDVKQILMQPLTFNPGNTITMNYTPTEVGGFWEHHRRMIEHLTNR